MISGESAGSGGFRRDHNRELTAVVDRIRRLAQHNDDRDGRTRWVGIDGCGAAGKSALADAIAARVPESTVVRVDDFSAPDIAEWDWDRFDTEVVQPLLAGRPAHYQRWDWARNAGAEWHEIQPGRTVVVEGVSSTRREVRVPWSLTIWVDAPRELRLQRVRERDGEAMMSRWLHEWLPSEDAYVARERPQQRVDVIVHGDGGRLGESRLP
jgi:uridine kinase